MEPILINNFQNDQVVINNNGKRFAIESDLLDHNFQIGREI
jgi:hypothetical protein